MSSSEPKNLTGAIAHRILNSLPSIAVKLQEVNMELFGTYDKQRSESEFRICISLPLLAFSMITLIMSWGQSNLYWPWVSAITFISTLVLAWRGIEQNFSADDVLITLLEVGAVKSTDLERLKSLEPDFGPNSSIASPSRRE